MNVNRKQTMNKPLILWYFHPFYGSWSGLRIDLFLVMHLFSPQKVWHPPFYIPVKKNRSFCGPNLQWASFSCSRRMLAERFFQTGQLKHKITIANPLYLYFLWYSSFYGLYILYFCEILQILWYFNICSQFIGCHSSKAIFWQVFLGPVIHMFRRRRQQDLVCHEIIWWIDWQNLT